MDYDTNALRKKVNEIQKEISAKKKVKIDCSFDEFLLMGLNRQNNLQMTSLLRRRRSMLK